MAGLSTRSASLIRDVGTLFLLETELETLGVLIANTAFTARLALLEIPAGVVASHDWPTPLCPLEHRHRVRGEDPELHGHLHRGRRNGVVGCRPRTPQRHRWRDGRPRAVSYRPNDASLLTVI